MKNINTKIYFLIFLLVLIVPLLIYLQYFNDPILESHGYRQTQTAVVTFWMIKDGFRFFNYLMPVIGYPWSAPLEFPLFQYIVAKIVFFSGYDLQIIGRSVSLFFYYLSAIPLLLILKKYGRIAIVIALILYFTSPIQLLYSRAFLIENCALFFSLCGFYFYNKTRVEKSSVKFLPLSVIAFFILGSISGLQKITTFFPVLLVCLIDFTFKYNFKSLFNLYNLRNLINHLIILSSIFPAYLYSKYSDNIKKLGYITSSLTSYSQNSWIFGDFSYRLNYDYFFKVFGYRLIFLGGFLFVTIFIIINFYKYKSNYTFKINREVLVPLSIGLVGPLVFAPLFYVHDYYYVASISFLILSFSIFIEKNLLLYKNNLIYFLLIFIIVSNYSIFYLKYHSKLTSISEIDATAILVGNYLKENLKSDEVSLIVGMDWSSTIPFYSERYALMIPSWYSNYQLLDSKSNEFIFGKSFGSVVICSNLLWPISISNVSYIKNLNKLVNGPEKSIGLCSVRLNIHK